MPVTKDKFLEDSILAMEDNLKGEYEVIGKRRENSAEAIRRGKMRKTRRTNTQWYRQFGGDTRLGNNIRMK